MMRLLIQRLDLTRKIEFDPCGAIEYFEHLLLSESSHMNK
jgi:hypothetical protein